MGFSLIVGLGNPGIKYYNTRHNAGFRVVDILAEKHPKSSWSKKREWAEMQIHLSNQPITLLKPMTYMNKSGEPVRHFLSDHDILPDEMIVVHDDLDLCSGRVKIKHGGGCAGHKGVQSIIENLNSDDFTRIRIGIGRPEVSDDVVDFVLRPCGTDDESIDFARSLDSAACACQVLVYEGLKSAMNKVNIKNQSLEKQESVVSGNDNDRKSERGNYSENV